MKNLKEIDVATVFENENEDLFDKSFYDDFRTEESYDKMVIETMGEQELKEFPYEEFVSEYYIFINYLNPSSELEEDEFNELMEYHTKVSKEKSKQKALGLIRRSESLAETFGDDIRVAVEFYGFLTKTVFDKGGDFLIVTGEIIVNKKEGYYYIISKTNERGDNTFLGEMIEALESQGLKERTNIFKEAHND